MAAVKKFTHSSVSNILRHNAREIFNSSNEDIRFERSAFNYKLSPDWKFLGMPQDDYTRYKFRLSQLYVYNRADVKTLAGWIVTAPQDLSVEQHDIFFLESYKFLENKYGRENVVQAIVHNDEAQPHLHFCFIPVVPDTNPNHKHTEKVCANDILTRQELRDFHPALQSHLRQAGIQARIINGVTAAGNRTVKEMKRERDTQHQHERQHEQRGVFIR